MPVYRTTRRVEFADTDAAGIMHFAAYFRFMEQAEHELLRHLGLSVIDSSGDETISWPRVHAKCDFRGAVKFEDVIDIEVGVARLGEKSVTYRFTMTHQARPVADGEMTAVCCRLEHGKPPRSVLIPAPIAERLATCLQP
jgi:acyl-CoA thioester hydrolase